MSPIHRNLARCAALLLLAGPSFAQNRPIELKWLRNAGAKFTGTTVNQKVGQSVAAAGNVHDNALNENIGDILIGAPEIGLDPLSDPPGHVYVYFGKTGVTASADTNAADVTIVGENNGWQTGCSVAGVGDVNGDGLDDILIGAPQAKTNNHTASGRAYLLWGGPTLTGTVNLASLTPAQGVVINGAQFSDRLGTCVAGAGDVDNDGTPDLLLGANGEGSDEAATGRGSAYVVYGSGALPAVLDIEAPPVGTSVTKYVGVAASDDTGSVVAGAGDVNGDGCDDVLIGAEKAPAGATNTNGAAYLVWGNSNPVKPTTVPLSPLGAAGVTITGTNNGDSFGQSVSSGGDVDADGRMDMVFGAPNANVTASNAEGRAYLVLGSASLSGTFAASAIGGSVAGTLFNGTSDPMQSPPNGDKVGGAVAGGGDTNGDGLDDLLIGAGAANYGGQNNCGTTYLWYGRAAPPASQPLAILNQFGVALEGEATLDSAGTATSGGPALAFAGDVDGDGFGDLLIGAEHTDPAGTDSGAAYLVKGTCHMIQAVGPVSQANGLTLRVHGAPGAANITFASVGAMPTPIPTKFGPWWFDRNLTLITVFSFSFGTNGEMFLPQLAVPSGLVNVPVDMQTLGAPQGQHLDLTYLLSFKIE